MWRRGGIVGRGVVDGLLAVYAEGFRQHLLDRGYTEGSAARLIHLMAHVSRWIDVGGLSPSKLTADQVAAFVTWRRAEGCVGWRSARAVAPMLEYLRELGVVPEEEPDLRWFDRLAAGYESYLVNERGATTATRRAYLGVAARFLGGLPVVGEEELGSLSAATVSSFVTAECSRRSPGSASSTTTGMRAFLRFLFLEGITPVPLSAAVPSPAMWGLAGLPRSVPSSQAADLLAACDRQSVVGRRDFAILKLLIRLGLRAGEVADMQLEHIDWHHGEIHLRGKAHRAERLPLPADVGEAIVAWLGDRRPSGGAARAVFTRLRAPQGPLNAGSVGAVVRHACDRAGYPRVGPHRLRHTTGTELLRAGADLNEIGRVLRHRRLRTTAIYAKVDIAALSQLALPWPGTRS
jgi:integrase/recombinase XerD